MTKITGKVKAVSGPNEYDGVMQIGFVLAEEPEKWHNLKGDEGLLEDFLKIVKKGAEIEFDEDANKNITNLKLIKAAPEGKWEDDIVSFETLLTKAHALKAPFSIKTKMLDLNLEKKYALFKARIEIFATAEQYKKYHVGEISEESKNPVRMKILEFEAHGDATAENVTGEHIKPHFIRMAETRAIVRALRWYTNNGCAEEEK